MNNNIESSETAAELPEDIIYELLLRQQPRNLHQYNKVSKAWRSIITFHPRFQEDYLFRHHLNVRLLISIPDGKRDRFYQSALRFRDRDAEPFKLLFSLPGRHPNRVETTQVVNGLVCYHYMYPGSSSLNVYNIRTKHIWEGPRRQYMRRAFLGYDPVGQVYKVMGFALRECWVFTLGLDSDWRMIASDKAMIFCDAFPSIWLNTGFIYWMCIYGGGRFLLSFDLHKEKFQRIQVPHDYRHRQMRRDDHSTFAQFGGKLALIEIVGSGLILKTLEDEKGDSWLIHHIPFPCELRYSRHGNNAYIAVSNLPSGQLLLANLGIVADSEESLFTPVYSYDPLSNMNDHRHMMFGRFVVGKFPRDVQALPRLGSAFCCY